MRRVKDDLDRTTEKILKRDPSMKERFEKADRAWDIAFQIVALRKKRGLSQKELAKLTGTSQAAIARIENADYTGYTLSTLEKVTKALDARIDLIVVPAEKEREYKKLPQKPLLALS